MSGVEQCSFHRNSEGIGLGKGLGHCDLDGGQTVCSGDLNFCEKPSELKKYRSEQKPDRKNRRQYPRFLLDLPLEYLVTNTPKTYGGLVVNVSEVGLLIRSIKNLPIGTELKIVVLFAQVYELANFEVLAQVVRKEALWEADWEGFEYGLKFIRILEEDHRKLKQILSGQLASQGVS